MLNFKLPTPRHIVKSVKPKKYTKSIHRETTQNIQGVPRDCRREFLMRGCEGSEGHRMHISIIINCHSISRKAIQQNEGVIEQFLG